MIWNLTIDLTIELKSMNGHLSSAEKYTEVSVGSVRILCAANATYGMPLCVMLTSVLLNHDPERKIEIYVLATRLPVEDRRKIEASLRENCRNFEHATMHWLAPSLEIFQKFPLTEHADIEVYSRLLAPFVLPEECDRVLYLDCDTIILTDLSPFHDSPCEGAAILAVRDETGTAAAGSGVFNYSDLGISPEAPYFNSGVMLINLKYWREHRVAERSIEYLRQHLEAVISWDQGALNAILHDSWVEVDSAWNSMRCSLHPEIWKRNGRSMEDWRRTLWHPKIIHYTGEKPWNDESLPRYSYFFDYLDKTDYRGTVKGSYLEHIIGFRYSYFLWRTRLFYFPILVRRIKAILRPVLKPPFVLIKKLLRKR